MSSAKFVFLDPGRLTEPSHFLGAWIYLHKVPSNQTPPGHFPAHEKFFHEHISYYKRKVISALKVTWNGIFLSWQTNEKPMSH
jgi:hypothetical protein